MSMAAAFERQRQLARIPEDRPERCLFEAHPWTIWGPWIPAKPPQARFLASDALLELPAYRWRICGRCGCEQRQSFAGEIVMLADPSGIQRELARRTSI